MHLKPSDPDGLFIILPNLSSYDVGSKRSFATNVSQLINILLYSYAARVFHNILQLETDIIFYHIPVQIPIKLKTATNHIHILFEPVRRRLIRTATKANPASWS